VISLVNNKEFLYSQDLPVHSPAIDLFLELDTPGMPLADYYTALVDP